MKTGAFDFYEAMAVAEAIFKADGHTGWDSASPEASWKYLHIARAALEASHMHRRPQSMTDIMHAAFNMEEAAA